MSEDEGVWTRASAQADREATSESRVRMIEEPGLNREETRRMGFSDH